MKKTAFLLIVSLLLIALAACKKDDPAGIIGGADGPTAILITEQSEPEPKLLQGTVTGFENGALLIKPVEGSAELAAAETFSVPITNMPASPEPQTGDTVSVLYTGDITGTSPAFLGEVLHIEIVARGENAPEEGVSAANAALCIDGVTYYNTGEAVPAEPEESAIEYAEIPAGGAVMIEAFSRLEEGKLLVCRINGEWYRFEAK